MGTVTGLCKVSELCTHVMCLWLLLLRTVNKMMSSGGEEMMIGSGPYVPNNTRKMQQ